MTDSPYRKGFEAMQEAMKSSGGNSFGKTNNIFWQKDGESKVIRLLTDDIYTVPIHEFIPTTQTTSEGKVIKAEFVCSTALATPRPCIICGTLVPNFAGDLEPAKPALRTLGLAVLRQELPNGDVEDVLHDEAVKVVVDGEEKELKNVPVVGIIKQGQRNFWDMFTGYYSRYGTTTDRDYLVTRQGKNKDTRYNVIPLDVDPERGTARDPKATAEKLAEVYKNALGSHPSLIEYIEKMGSQERYDYFLAGKVAETEEDHPGGLDEFAETSATSNGESSLGLKLMGHRKQS